MKSHFRVATLRKFFFISLILIISCLAIFAFTENFEITSKNENWVQPLDFYEAKNEQNESIHITEFNPNDLNSEQWQKLGFTNKQAASILKYKQLLGEFSSKEDLKKCFVISFEKFQQIEPYILLPENNDNSANYTFSKINNHKKSLHISRKFNPNQYSIQNWTDLGFSEKQAEAIIKYKEYLGGSFPSKEKFKECFVISSENYKKIAPFLLLPEKTILVQNKLKNINDELQKIKYSDFDPNDLNYDAWKNLGFSEKQVSTILNYKNKILKGHFKTPEDVKNCYVISEGKFNEIKPYIKIKPFIDDISEASTKKENIQKTDFSSVDLNSITYSQLIEFGFDEHAAGSFIGFRNKLGGFVNEDQILETYNIDKELTQKLINKAILDISKVQKYTINSAPESWMKNHPYFKYYADKILFYRITYSDEKKIFAKMKLKPETEAKMKLYLE